jgi:hypothetical protein
MRLQLPAEPTDAFVPFPADLLSNPARIDWPQTEVLYRIALQRAEAAFKPTIIDRLAPYWN